MKILQVVPSYKPAFVYGGPIESVAKLCEGLTAAGHSVDVYTTTANGATELPVEPNKTVLIDGVSVTYFKRITKDHTHISPALWRQLYRNCRNYDMVHIQSWWNILVIVAAIICHFRKVKVVISPRGMLSNYIIQTTNSRAKQLIHSLAGQKALAKSSFHATSEAEYEECKQLIKGWQGFMIPNILSLPDLSIQKQQNKQFTLLFLSRIHPKKGIELLLEAISKISDDILLRIAGSGDEMYIRELKEKAKELCIEHKIEWLGWKNRTEKFAELMKADLFVLTSYNENFANVVIESLHAGTPVLVSDKVGLAQFVQEQNVGWVTSLNSTDIAKHITTAINNAGLRDKISVEGPYIINRFFAADKLIADYVTEYRKLISL